MIDVTRRIRDHEAVIAGLAKLVPAIEDAAGRMVACLSGGGKILWMGNGGSAADAQHMAAEIVGRFLRERRPLPSIALTTDTSALTALGNDFGFDQVFARQVEALARPGDVVVAISTSGNSENVLAGVRAARVAGAVTVALTGAGGGALGGLADVLLAAPSDETPRIQEAHLLIEHILCDAVDAAFAE